MQNSPTLEREADLILCFLKFRYCTEKGIYCYAFVIKYMKLKMSVGAEGSGS